MKMKLECGLMLLGVFSSMQLCKMFSRSVSNCMDHLHYTPLRIQRLPPIHFLKRGNSASIRSR